MAETKIQWCHWTFNPWLGCSKVHAGCTNCYAENHQAVAMRQGGKIAWGEAWQGGQRVVVSDSTWQHPFTWARKAAKAGERHRVFCASLADVLEVPAMPPANWGLDGNPPRREAAVAVALKARKDLGAARERLWDTIRKTAAVTSAGQQAMTRPSASEGAWKNWPGLDWLLLTKRPENWRLVPEDVRPLVWLGTSASDDETMRVWAQRLMEARGFRYRFLSLEPLTGAVNAEPWLTPIDVVRPDPHGRDQRFDWVIVGGESGPKARPCNVEWVRSIVRQCREAGVPCFVKQLGAQVIDGQETWNEWRSRGASFVNRTDGMGRVILSDDKGGDMSEWPEDLRVRMFPGERWES